jgi:hypothetical protein
MTKNDPIKMADLVLKVANLHDQDPLTPQDRPKLYDALLDYGFTRSASIDVLTRVLPYPSDPLGAIACGLAWASNLPVKGSENKSSFPHVIKIFANYDHGDLDGIVSSLQLTNSYFGSSEDYTLNYYGVTSFNMNLKLNELGLTYLKNIGVGTTEIQFPNFSKELHRFFIAGVIEASLFKVIGLSTTKIDGEFQVILDREDNDILLIFKNNACAKAIIKYFDKAILTKTSPFTEHELIDSVGNPTGVIIPQAHSGWFISNVIKYSNRVQYYIRNPGAKEDLDRHPFYKGKGKLNAHEKEKLNSWIELQRDNNIKVTPQMLCNIATTTIDRDISYVTAWNILKDEGLIKKRFIALSSARRGHKN